MKNFAITGVAGFIAVRHLKAIKETGNNLLVALDKGDSVGIIDSYFPQAHFFTEFERFDRHVEKLRRENVQLDYVSICTPNYLHDAHIRFALRHGADAICEKPVVLNPWNIDALQVIEKETGKKVNNVLQLRLHTAIMELKERIEKGPKDKIYDVDLSYITSRGKWYHVSWKGDIAKSGGVATNIGVHFFDMLTWIFGDIKENVVHYASATKMAGFLQLKQARVRWFLSVDYDDIPEAVRKQGKRTYRVLNIDGSEFEFSEGFTDLHTRLYNEILKGNGFALEECRKAIEAVYTIRNVAPIGLKGDYHPLCKSIIK